MQHNLFSTKRLIRLSLVSYGLIGLTIPGWARSYSSQNIDVDKVNVKTKWIIDNAAVADALHGQLADLGWHLATLSLTYRAESSEPYHGWVW